MCYVTLMIITKQKTSGRYTKDNGTKNCQMIKKSSKRVKRNCGTKKNSESRVSETREDVAEFKVRATSVLDSVDGLLKRQRDLKHANNLPSSAQVTKHFGSLQNLLKEANIVSTTNPKLFQREELSDEEMLDNYRRFVEDHLKTHIYLPTNDEVDACPYIQCASVYIRRFGSFERINELIGYNQKEFNNTALEKDMLFKYKRACEEYGHTLDSREITKICKETDNYIYSTEAYLNHFGTLHNLQEICGFDKTVPGRGATRDELIDKLQWLLYCYTKFITNN